MYKEHHEEGNGGGTLNLVYGDSQILLEEITPGPKPEA